MQSGHSRTPLAKDWAWAPKTLDAELLLSFHNWFSSGLFDLFFGLLLGEGRNGGGIKGFSKKSLLNENLDGGFLGRGGVIGILIEVSRWLFFDDFLEVPSEMMKDKTIIVNAFCHFKFRGKNLLFTFASKAHRQAKCVCYESFTQLRFNSWNSFDERLLILKFHSKLARHFRNWLEIQAQIVKFVLQIIIIKCKLFLPDVEVSGLMGWSWSWSFDKAVFDGESGFSAASLFFFLDFNIVEWYQTNGKCRSKMLQGYFRDESLVNKNSVIKKPGFSLPDSQEERFCKMLRYQMKCFMIQVLCVCSQIGEIWRSKLVNHRANSIFL